MGRVWSEAHKYELWCSVEVMVLEAHAEAGVVPADSVEPVRTATPPTPEAVAEIEAVTQHDVIAFLSAWADNTEPREAAAYVHFGMTSSDLLDTALEPALDAHLATVAAQGDPGYAATAVMLGESALCLALDGERLPAAAGVLTPATAMGDALVDRLRAQDFTLTVDELPDRP